MNPVKKMEWNNLVLFHFFDVCREQWPTSKTLVDSTSVLAKYLASLTNARNEWINRRIQTQNKIAKQSSIVVCLACVSLNRILVIAPEIKIQDTSGQGAIKQDVKWIKQSWRFNPNPSMMLARFITDPAPEISTSTEQTCPKLIEFLQLASLAKNPSTTTRSLDPSLSTSLDQSSVSSSLDKPLDATRVIKIDPDSTGQLKEKMMHDPWLQTHEINSAIEDFNVDCALLISTFDSLVRFHVQHAIRSLSNVGNLWHDFFDPDTH